MNLNEVLSEVENNKQYKAFFKSQMKQMNINSLDDLSDDQKKIFFNKIDRLWKAKNESSGKKGRLSLLNPSIMGIIRR